MGFSQNQVYLVHNGPKSGTHEKQVKTTRHEPCHWPASHSTFFSMKVAGYTRLYPLGLRAGPAKVLPKAVDWPRPA